MSRTSKRVLLLAAVLCMCLPTAAWAGSFVTPYNTLGYSATTLPGVGLSGVAAAFEPGTNALLFSGSGGSIWDVSYTRGAGNHITSLDSKTLDSRTGAGYIDAGMAFGPGVGPSGNLFYTDGYTLGQYAPGDITPTVTPLSAAGISPVTGFGALMFYPGIAGDIKLLISYSDKWWDTTLTPSGSYYIPTSASPTALPGSAGIYGAAYGEGPGPGLSTGAILVTENGNMGVTAYPGDVLGNPVMTPPPSFHPNFYIADNYTGGMAVDPLTGDVLLAQWNDYAGASDWVRISGFNVPGSGGGGGGVIPEPGTVTLLGTGLALAISKLRKKA